MAADPDVTNTSKPINVDRCRALIDRMLVNIKDAPETGGGSGWNKQEAVAAYQKLKDTFEQAVAKAMQT